MSKIPEMANHDIVNVNYKNRILAALGAFFIIMKCMHPTDNTPPDSYSPGLFSILGSSQRPEHKNVRDGDG